LLQQYNQVERISLLRLSPALQHTQHLNMEKMFTL